MENLTIVNASKRGILQDPSLPAFILVVDVCLASFSLLNLIVNFSVSLLCVGFVRGQWHSSSDVNTARPHYGLHVFIFHCVFSSFLLECIGAVTNIGYIFTGHNVIIAQIEPIDLQQTAKKLLDFLTYSLFNVSHLNFVLLLNVDKLLYILRPLHYHELMNRTRVRLVSLVTWLVSMAMASPSLMYLDLNAQIRQEAILFAMCVVCPASFDLLSAIIVSTIVYRIQLRDTRTRLSIRQRSGSNRSSIFCRNSRERDDSVSINQSITGYNRQGINHSTILCQEFFRHCRVFLRSFTPIIWTCFTTLPYTATMIYLYFGSDSDEEFVRRWTDITMFKVLRALGCLYVAYFTGVPLIIIFHNHMYRRRIKALFRSASAKLTDWNKRIDSQKYSSDVSRAGYTTRTSVSCGASAPLTSMGNACGVMSDTEM